MEHNPVNALMIGNEEEEEVNLTDVTLVSDDNFVKLRRGSGKDWQGMASKAKALKA